MKRTHLLAITLLLILTALGQTAAPAGAREVLRVQRVDASNYPTINIQLGLTTRDKAAGFKLWENNRRIKSVKVSSQVSKEPVEVTLLMDVSGSMKNKPLADAKTAAKLFIEQAKPTDKISIIAFDSSVDHLAEFTSDKIRLNAVIDGLQAGGETAVYDGLLKALDVARHQSGTNSSVILLSDGGDTASKASLPTVTELASRLKIPVSAIALQSSEFNAAPLTEIANASGGQLLTAVDSSGLTELYDGLAAELHNRYHLAYRSQAKAGRARVSVEATIADRSLRAFAGLSGLPMAKKLAVKPPRSSYTGQFDKFANPWLSAGLAFTAVFMLVLALANLFLPSGNILAEQLKYYDQLRGQKSKETDKPKIQQARDTMVDAVSAVSAKYDFADYARLQLEQAGLPVKPNEYITMHILAIIAASLVAFLLTGNGFSALLLTLIVALGPLLAIAYKIEQRKTAFAEQLADTLDLIAGSMRAGFGLQQALATAGREAREPTAGELMRVSHQVQMGMSLEEALTRMADRVGDVTFRWVVLAITIHREAGGNLAEILDNLAATIRDRQTLKRQVNALTAEGKLSAYILIVLPFIEGLILFFVNPGYMQLLFTTVPGALMLSAALALLVVGAVWLRKITVIEY